MFTFLIIVGAALALTWVLFGAYTLGHFIGFERGMVENHELELDALALREVQEARKGSR